MNVPTILDKYYGIKTNKWVRLSDVITVIYLDQDANLYTDPDELYFFDSSTNILTISKNYNYHKLTEIKTAYGSYKPNVYVDMSKISGFVSTCVLGPYGTIIERPY